MPNPVPQRVTATPVDPALERDLRRARALAHAMDAKFEAFGIKFGYDSLIGLLPGVGDVATSAVSLYPIYLAGRHEAGAWTVARMLGNVGVDFLTGLIPLAGDLADVAFKANLKNLRLFEEAVARKRGVVMPPPRVGGR